VHSQALDFIEDDWDRNIEGRLGDDQLAGDVSPAPEAHGTVPSMSRIGNPYDNAEAESFMKTLKHEEVDGRDYRNLSQAPDAIGASSRTPTGRRAAEWIAVGEQ
jgi:transposase InsO family protein